ncbi:MAG: transglycosylase SLT domain-containing protein [Deltaproteobacteria bacterium]|nr:transglycosylase SLT domain-containing protein [Deltaproteobacteria bacterium]
MRTKKKKVHRARPWVKKTPATKPISGPVHPWRVCPVGQHYRRATTVRPHVRGGHPIKGGPRSGTCVDNPSGKDQLYDLEMHEIAERHFEQFRSFPLGSIQEFKNSTYPQNAYDHLIQGWTQYWNDVLKPNVPLDPKLVKALIATESGFNPSSWNGKRGPKRARGLTQVTDGSVQRMKHKSPEFTDHYLHLNEDDMLDPNLTICAGVRWLHRKKRLASGKLGREATWIEAIAEYKSYLKPFMKNPNHTQMRRFITFYEELKNAP